MNKSVCDVPMRTSFPIPERVDRKNNPEGSVIRIKGNDIGGNGVIIIAGPCAVESKEQLFETAALLEKIKHTSTNGEQ